MRQLPTGILTLFFTDIEGSTRLLQQLGDRYAGVLRDCRRLLRTAFQLGNGYEVDTQGDAFFVVFERAVDAVTSAITAQRALFTTGWPDDVQVRVRIGIHTGEPQLAEEGYIGLDVHRAARIMGAAHGGQVLLSRSTRDQVAHDLPPDVSLNELGQYHLKDIAGLQELFQVAVPDLPADFPPPAASSPLYPIQNLPSPSTSFVGREQEVAAVSERLRRVDVRMITLLGTAGVGKTRLALQVAEQLTDLFMNGVCFVSLEQVNDADSVVPALAQALNIAEEKGHSLFEQIKTTLQKQSVLLILDNFEHVMPARRIVADLLIACPRLKILVTSRIMLHLQAEHLFEVHPLTVPDPSQSTNLNALKRNASVSLFVQRAQAVQPNFQLTQANAAAVVEICRHLDGIPLAIELAAARTRYFPPQALLSNLQKGLAFLQTSSQDLPERQQTLRGAIAWSYDLLQSSQQCIFRRLAVCVSGIPLEAAEQICTAAGAIDGNILEALEALVDQTMLQQQVRESGEVRFWLLQTLREYGLELLAQTGELEITQAAFAEYYLAWTEQITPLLIGAEQTDWLDRLDREYENVRASLEWLLEHAQRENARAEQALRLCIALMIFWEVRGHISEGLALLERSLADGQHVAPSVRAQALHDAGFLALMLDDNARAEAFLRQSQLLFRETGDKAGMANILRLQGTLAQVRNNYKIARRLLEEALSLYQACGDVHRVVVTRDSLAQVAIAQGDYNRARLLLEESLAAYRALGEQYNTAYPLYLLARTHFFSRGELAKARSMAEESLTLFSEVGNRRLMAHVRNLLGQILLVGGEDGIAGTLFEESLATFRAIGDRSGIAEVEMSLGRLAAYQGDNQAALTRYEESWNLLQTIGAKELNAACLEAYGEIVAQDRPEWAVRIWGTAATVRAGILAPMPPIYRTSYLAAVAATRNRLGEEAFQAAWAAGHRMPMEQVQLVG
ncbi:MAG TPA: tetratricopeptide repeat protein [Ktedonobacteraceae bacterium]|nr:tetratricopeptide repeat protein [Ktedonobacteraceae bacterium]